jgi:hypothetical protein
MDFSNDERTSQPSRFAYNGLTESIAVMIGYVIS